MVLTTQPRNPYLDLDAWVGQRSATFRFDLVDAVTGYRTEVHPLADPEPTLVHNVEQTIVRQLTNLFFGEEDTLTFNSVSSRLELFMIVRGTTYPLGRYVPISHVRIRYTSGLLSTATFFDEGIIVDQELEASFSTSTHTSTAREISSAITRLLSPLPIKFYVEPSPYFGTMSWPAGTRRGTVTVQLAVDGDYFNPWFNHQSVQRYVRAFDPATQIPTFDFDAGNKVMRERITETDDLIDAPNRFVVISNGASSVTSSVPTFGVYDVPSSAPHSITNRGFVITKTENRQLDSLKQAEAVARNIGLRNTIFERTELYTAPDPRHDGYDVIHWRGVNWLETGWSLPLREGSQMQHIMRRYYRD